MPRRPWTLPCVAILLAGLAALPACKKKPPAEPDGAPAAPAAPTGPPAAVSSDYLLFARLDAKAVRGSEVFAELKQAVVKAGGQAEWDQAEEAAGRQFGVKLNDVLSLTVCVTEFPARGEPKAVVVIASSSPVDKTAFHLGKQAKPDDRGFYKAGRDGLVHFPDDKTAVMLHPDLAQQYLNGYAKDRTGWPMTPELTKAAGGHALFVTANLKKLPQEALRGPDAKQFESLLAAQTVTLTADLRGKALTAAARATFPDAAAANKAKETVQNFLGLASGAVEHFLGDKNAAALGSMKPAVQEAQRTLKDAKPEVSGSDLTLAATYKIDFDIPAVLGDAVKKVREAAARTKAQNNLKMVGLALHSFIDGNRRPLIHATGAKGRPLENDKDKPLLSWRVAILPYIEQGPLYNQFKLDEPWDSPNNKKLIEKMPAVFAPVNKPGKPGYTHLQMVVGPNAMRPGMSFPASFTDGTSNTIAVVEAAEPVFWTKPDDVMVPGKEWPKDLKTKFGGQFPGGFNVLMWDGSVRFIRDSVSDRTLRALLTPAGGEVLGSDW